MIQMDPDVMQIALAVDRCDVATANEIVQAIRDEATTIMEQCKVHELEFHVKHEARYRTIEESLINLTGKKCGVHENIAILHARVTEVEDLAMLLRRCLHRMSKERLAPSLCEQAGEYLERHGLSGSILREDGSA